MHEIIGSVCAIFKKLADIIWGFPTNYEWYKGIPIIGELPLVVIFLVGSGLYFTFSLRFVQVRHFVSGVRSLCHSKTSQNGISPLAAFLLSTAMRVGPGNILGVTGAVSTGGPGALFWMWLSAFFGMATAFVESTLSQITKERQGEDYIGGMPCYGKKLLGQAAWVGSALSFLYIGYAMLSTPAQGFNTLSAIIAACNDVTGNVLPANSWGIWFFFLVLMGLTVFSIFGGLKRIISITDVLVPFMAAVYIVIVLVMIMMHPGRLPWFFYVVVTEAFRPEPVFGGVLGIAISQGIKRGLMSNEAGQGTLTVPAAVSDASHPCEQGVIQAIGVFFDTIVICTMTGFVLVMGQAWLGDGASAWFRMELLDRFLTSCSLMIGGGFGYRAVTLIVAVCFGIFAYTSLLGYLSVAEICAKQITDNKYFILAVRFSNLGVLAFGMAASISGFDLNAIWNLSDFANITMVCCNLPLLYLGLAQVRRAAEHYERGEGQFCSATFGADVPVWDEKWSEGQALT
ncbi:amino acid carrier protein [bacterium]|nr:amino acid carrier protein [bacterium]